MSFVIAKAPALKDRRAGFIINMGGTCTRMTRTEALSSGVTEDALDSAPGVDPKKVTDFLGFLNQYKEAREAGKDKPGQDEIQEYITQNFRTEGEDAFKDFRGANLSGAYLVDVDFKKCRLSGCNLEDAVCDGTSFRRARMIGCALSGGSFIGASFCEAEMHLADFLGANMKKARWLRISQKYWSISKCDGRLLHTKYGNICDATNISGTARAPVTG